MRSLLAAILSLFLPPRGAHRSLDAPPFLTAPTSAPTRRTRVPAPDVVAADDLPLVRPYLAVWEAERDERDRWHRQRERRRAAVLATLGQDYVPSAAAA